MAEESILEFSPSQTPGSPVHSLTTVPWKLGQFLLTPSAQIQKGKIETGKEDCFAAILEHLARQAESSGSCVIGKNGIIQFIKTLP